MPELDDTFCSTYQPHADLDDFIENPDQDPTFRDFLQRYGFWEAGGANPSQAALWFNFADTADARRALEAGQGNNQGRVRQTHCDIFLTFVNGGMDLLSQARKEIAKAERKNTAGKTKPASKKTIKQKSTSKLTPFEIAIRCFQMGLPLNDATRGLLNGACFLVNRIQPIGVSGDVEAEIKEFYAIPGSAMLNLYKQNLADPLWGGILDRIEKGTAAARLKTINIELAMQLRLGRKKPPHGTPEDYQPIPVGSGMIIMGGE